MSTPGPGLPGRDGLHERMPAHSDSVVRLRRQVVRFAEAGGVSLEQRENIALAVSEALSNAVVHAYPGRHRHGIVEVRASLLDDAFVVTVRDEGVGLITRFDGPGLGLGLGLIDQVTRRLQLSDAQPGLCVRMTFAIA